MIGVLNAMSLVIGLTGVAVIFWGTLITVVQVLKLEYRQFSGFGICQKRELMRHHFGSYILLGLEFMIAADIVHTVMQPDLGELAGLGAIVAIRTLLSYFLDREMKTHSCSERPQEQRSDTVTGRPRC